MVYQNRAVGPYRYYNHIDTRTYYVVDYNGYIWVQMEGTLQNVGLEAGLIYIVMADGYDAYENIKQYISEHLLLENEKKLDIFLKGNEAQLKKDGQEDSFRERVAELCHNQWSNWTDYIFSKTYKDYFEAPVIPRHLTERWKRQIDTDYYDLSEEEMDSDRKEADKFIELFKKENENLKQILLSIEDESRSIKTAAIDPFIVVEHAEKGLNKINALSKAALKSLE
jgi:hypothetical protein